MSENSMLTPKRKGRYLSIFSDGSLREKVDKGTDNAIEREYEIKDGVKVTTGVKYELHYESLVGRITGVKFRDGEYGQQILIQFTGTEGEILNLAIPTANNFGSDLMKKMPNIDFEKSMWFSPYSFIPENTEKEKRGISIKQGDVKVPDFFYDKEKKENINGFPVPEGDTNSYGKDDWKVYFINVKKFLVGYTEEKICPKFPESEYVAPVQPDYPDADDEGIKPEDIPF